MKISAGSGEKAPIAAEEMGLVKKNQTINFKFYIDFLKDPNSFCSSYYDFTSLRTKTQIIGWFYMLLGFILTTWYYLYFLAFDEDDDPVPISGAVYLLVVAAIVTMIPVFSLFLLIGVRKRDAALLKPFVTMLYIYMAFITFFYVLTLFALGSSLKEILQVLIVRAIVGFFILLGWYSFLVVNQYHSILHSESFGYKVPI